MSMNALDGWDVLVPYKPGVVMVCVFKEPKGLIYQVFIQTTRTNARRRVRELALYDVDRTGDVRRSELAGRRSKTCVCAE